MAIDLKQVLQTMKKEFNFVVKLAYCDEMTDESLSAYMRKVDIILKAKGMINRTRFRLLPLMSQPLEFRRLKGFIGKYYVCEMTFEYPITENEISTELSTLLHIDKAFISVRTSFSPIETEEANYEYMSDEEYIPMLVQDEIKTNINPNDYYGDEYNKNLVKTLMSKEGKQYQQGFKEVDPKTFKGYK